MRHRLAVVALGTILTLTGCSVGSISFGGPYPNATITASPTITSMAVGTSQTFTATITNDPDQAYWTVGQQFIYNPVNEGTINGGTTTVFGNSVTYTAPATPPIYLTGATPSQQGIATVSASVSTSLLSGVSATENIAIIAPTVTAGLTPATASVALGATANFVGYAVGNINNGVIWQVNDITGGSSSVGTISAVGVYTAPATLPMSGSTVTLTLTSAADPTKTASAVITLH
jgi:hypothetical protein